SQGAGGVTPGGHSGAGGLDRSRRQIVGLARRRGPSRASAQMRHRPGVLAAPPDEPRAAAALHVLRLIPAAVAFLLLVAAPARAAQASQIVSTSSVTNLVLGVNAKGEAMLTYVSRGRTVHVLAWGALNALPSLAPTAGPGEALDLAYDGGYTKYFR